MEFPDVVVTQLSTGATIMSWSRSVSPKPRLDALDELRDGLAGSMNQSPAHDAALVSVVVAAERLSAQATDAQDVGISTYGHIAQDGLGSASVTVTIGARVPA